MADRRVVVTGIGLVSSLGIGTEANWAALLAGQSGIGDHHQVRRVTQFATRIAGEVKGFDPLHFIEKKDVKKMDVFIQYAIAASQFAIDDAALTVTPENAPRVGVFIASGIGGFTTIEREHKALLEGGPRKISPFFIPSAIINLAAGQVSIRFGAQGPELGDVHRLLGVGARHRRRLRDHPARRRRRHDCRRIRSGHHADGHRRLRRAARAVDAQRRARARQPSLRQGSRRLHRRRRRRRADPRGVRGARQRAARASTPSSSATACPPTRTTSPRPPRTATARSASWAPRSKSAGIEPSRWTTSTPTARRRRTATRSRRIAIKRCFGDHATKLAVSSTKSMTGHLLGAAGGLEAGITVLAVYHQIVPPTINLDDPDAECDLDYVPNVKRADADRVRAVELLRLRRHERGAAVQALSRHERTLTNWSSGHLVIWISCIDRVTS